MTDRDAGWRARLAAHLAGRLGCLQDPVYRAPALPRAGTAPARGARGQTLITPNEAG